MAVFSSMHVADELWSRWDIGETLVTNAVLAGAVAAVPIPLTLLALAGIVLARRWGFVLGIVTGVLAIWSPLSHFINTDGLNAYRGAVAVLALLSAIALIASCARELTVLRTPLKARPAGL